MISPSILHYDLSHLRRCLERLDRTTFPFIDRPNQSTLLMGTIMWLSYMMLRVGTSGWEACIQILPINRKVSMYVAAVQRLYLANVRFRTKIKNADMFHVQRQGINEAYVRWTIRFNLLLLSHFLYLVTTCHIRHLVHISQIAREVLLQYYCNSTIPVSSPTYRPVM